MKFQGFKDEIGYAIGIVSSIFYIGSRTAQLYKNVSILMICSGSINRSYFPGPPYSIKNSNKTRMLFI